MLLCVAAILAMTSILARDVLASIILLTAATIATGLMIINRRTYRQRLIHSQQSIYKLISSDADVEPMLAAFLESSTRHRRNVFGGALYLSGRWAWYRWSLTILVWIFAISTSVGFAGGYYMPRVLSMISGIVLCVVVLLSRFTCSAWLSKYRHQMDSRTCARCGYELRAAIAEDRRNSIQRHVCSECGELNLVTRSAEESAKDG